MGGDDFLKKTIVLLYPGFSEYELSVALSILMQGRKPIVTVGLTKDPIKGESGLSCIADATVEEVNLNEIDSLLLPGCMDIIDLIDEEALLDLIKGAASKDMVIAAISSSPTLLAKIDILKGKKFTVGMPEEGRTKLGIFEEKSYSDEVVVRDGNIITARGKGFIRFGILLGETLELEFDENWYIEQPEKKIFS